MTMTNASSEKHLLDKKHLSPFHANKVVKVHKKEDNNEKKDWLCLQKKLHMCKVREVEKTTKDWNETPLFLKFIGNNIM